MSHPFLVPPMLGTASSTSSSTSTASSSSTYASAVPSSSMSTFVVSGGFAGLSSFPSSSSTSSSSQFPSSLSFPPLATIPGTSAQDSAQVVKRKRGRPRKIHANSDTPGFPAVGTKRKAATGGSGLAMAEGVENMALDSSGSGGQPKPRPEKKAKKEKAEKPVKEKKTLMTTPKNKTKKKDAKWMDLNDLADIATQASRRELSREWSQTSIDHVASLEMDIRSTVQQEEHLQQQQQQAEASAAVPKHARIASTMATMATMATPPRSAPVSAHVFAAPLLSPKSSAAKSLQGLLGGDINSMNEEELLASAMDCDASEGMAGARQAFPAVASSGTAVTTATATTAATTTTAAASSPKGLQRDDRPIVPPSLGPRASIREIGTFIKHEEALAKKRSKSMSPQPQLRDEERRAKTPSATSAPAAQDNGATALVEREVMGLLGGSIGGVVRGGGAATGGMRRAASLESLVRVEELLRCNSGLSLSDCEDEDEVSALLETRASGGRVGATAATAVPTRRHGWEGEGEADDIEDEEEEEMEEEDQDELAAHYAASTSTDGIPFWRLNIPAAVTSSQSSDVPLRRAPLNLRSLLSQLNRIAAKQDWVDAFTRRAKVETVTAPLNARPEGRLLLYYTF